ncbi:superoxide dismutase [Opitutales bacterium]|jgi:superoxide dismutase, Fe-Mn family|nr:superoxide dismutase [Opitutales bacterium]
MPHSLPPLPYSPGSLEPHIDARTMEIHHGKHHQTYIDKLNAAISGHSDLESKSLHDLISKPSDIPEGIRTAVRNNGGGHANHCFFWETLSPQGGGTPSGKLAEEIDRSFGSLDSFKESFTLAALNRFGSGWAWLVQTNDGTLTITSTPNQDSPWMQGVADQLGEPLIGLDVWEHAYYLNYQNRRPDYVSAFWNVVDWNKASDRLRG